MVAALVQDSVRTVAERYGVSKSTLARHTKVCPTVLPPMGQVGNTAPTMGQPTAPTHLVNPQLHAEAMRLYDVLSNHNYLVDTRRGLLAVVALLLQVVKDAGEQ